MRDINKLPWMVAPKNFVRLLGAEYELMRDAGVLRRFYISSLLIVIILGLTWISVEYAIDLLFHTIVIEMTLAIFFCLLFVCIYIFILNTFSKDNSSNERIFNVSNIIRIGFIAFMGFLIAQPLLILLYASSLSVAVKEYKWNLQKMHIEKIDDLDKKEVTGLMAEKKYYMDQQASSATMIYNNRLDKIEDAIKRIQDNAASIKYATQLTIDNNSFFLYRIKKVNREYPLAWLLSFLIVLLFLLPGYLIYSISSQNDYYQLKKAREKRLVMEAYGLFAAHYELLFDGKVSVFSRYENPPFNTVRNQPPLRASMTDFLQKYLDNS